MSTDQEENLIPESFSDIHLENQILKLKMQAEFGAQISEVQDIPPHLEQLFLKKILELEEYWRTAPKVKIYDQIGQPEFKSHLVLKGPELELELRKLLDLLQKRNINFSLPEDYDPHILYQFITEELFYLEMEDLNPPNVEWLEGEGSE
ncbi:MAG: hypothetical protein ACJ75B_04330 [Flavisolibacter sp.]